MHISIPDSEEITETKGDAGSANRFVQYNIHINGTYHCSARYQTIERWTDGSGRDGW